MSLVTRCPACATTFKVVRDQLRISDGWVRCGRCSEVFDATIDLHDTTAPVPEATASESSLPGAVDHDVESEAAHALQSEPQPQSESRPEAEEEAEEEAMREDAEADFFDDEHESSNPDVEVSDVGDESTRDPLPLAGIASDVHWPDPESLTLEDEGRIAVRPPLPPPLSFPDIDLSLSSPVAAPAPAAEPVRADSEALAQDAAADVQLQKALRRAHAKSAKIAKAKAREQKAAAADTAPVILAASESEPSAASASDMPSPFGAEESGSFWRRAAVRRSMLVLAILAAVLLVGQVLYQERDLIVARQPSARPALVSMCKLLGCEISALRQINDIKVDGASFARGKSDEAYQLSFTLRNAADVPLAMPAVELTLLDTQERAVVRRVIMPSEFGAPVVLPARAERATSLALKLSGPEVQALPPVAGFRLEALYP